MEERDVVGLRKASSGMTLVLLLFRVIGKNRHARASDIRALYG